MPTKLLNRLKDVVEAALIGENIAYFIGGSTRFGYDTASSDIDVFIYTDGDKIQNIIDKLIPSLGDFHPYADRNYLNTKQMFRSKTFPIHIGFIKSQTIYKLEFLTHLKIDKLLEEYPILIDVARIEKGKGIAGSSIFLMLSALATEKEKRVIEL